MPVLGTSRLTNGKWCPLFIFLLALSVSGVKEQPIVLHLLQHRYKRYLIILWHWFLLFLWPVHTPWLTIGCWPTEIISLTRSVNFHVYIYSNSRNHMNFHMAIHVYDFLCLFEPVWSWWSFLFECLVGQLQHLPHNHKFGIYHFSYNHVSHSIPMVGKLEATMGASFIKAANSSIGWCWIM